MHLGYKLSSEEFGPQKLVRMAERAENAGFDFGLISDHYHPWTSTQGESPFVWGALGGIAEATDSMRIGTGVTCPTMRIHPAIIAQASATAARMMPERFFFGVGTGENLNEHILGQSWPPHRTRTEMLEEAVEIIRRLWNGGTLTHYGDYYTVENAKLFTAPENSPPINVAASGPRAAKAAARFGDGIVSTAPKTDIIDTFEEEGGEGNRYGELVVCWDENRENALETAKEHWPNSALKGELNQHLPMPAHFEQAAQMVRDEDIKELYVLGNNIQEYIEQIKQYQEAGFDHVSIHQIGPDQQGFIQFFEEELRPELESSDIEL